MFFHNPEGAVGVLNNSSVVSAEEKAELEVAAQAEKEREEQISTKDVIKVFCGKSFNVNAVDSHFKKPKGFSRNRLRAIFAVEVPETHKVKVKFDYGADGKPDIREELVTRVKRDKDGKTSYKENPKGLEHRKAVEGRIKAVKPELLPKWEECLNDLFSDFRRGRGPLDMEAIMADINFEMV